MEMILITTHSTGSTADDNQVGDVRYNVVSTAQRYKAGTCSMYTKKSTFQGSMVREPAEAISFTSE